MVTIGLLFVRFRRKGGRGCMNQRRGRLARFESHVSVIRADGQECSLCLYKISDSEVDELVLGLGLNHTGTLGS